MPRPSTLPVRIIPAAKLLGIPPRHESLPALPDPGPGQPVLVCPATEGTFHLALLGTDPESVPYRAHLKAIVATDARPKDAAELRELESLQATSLRAQAALPARLQGLLKCSTRQLVALLGKNHSDLARLIQLDRASEEVWRMLRTCPYFTVGHARPLLAMDHERQAQWVKVFEGTLPRAPREPKPPGVSAFARQVRGGLRKPARDQDHSRTRNRIAEALGTGVELDYDDTGRGAMKLAWFTPSDLEGLLERLSRLMRSRGSASGNHVARWLRLEFANSNEFQELVGGAFEENE
jgi:hypothetical protein